MQDLDRARELFTNFKHDIGYFLKYQTDLSFGEEAKHFVYTPKLLYLCLDQMLQLKPHDLIDFYQVLNGTAEFHPEYDNVLLDIKIALNKGVWAIINEIKEISIIAELLFDWLEDCVDHIVDPLNIEKIFTQHNQIEGQLKYLVSKPSSGELKQSQREIFSILKLELRVVELESLSFLGHFVSSILPDGNEDAKHEFQSMLTKLAIYVLGFNIDEYEQGQVVKRTFDRQEVLKVDKIVDYTVNLILFFVVTQDNLRAGDLDNKSVDNYLSNQYVPQYLPQKNLGELDQSLSVQNKTFEIKSPGKNQFKLQSLNSLNSYKTSNKEVHLFKMYKFLHHYFSHKSTSRSPTKFSRDLSGVEDLANSLNKFQKNRQRGSSFSNKNAIYQSNNALTSTEILESELIECINKFIGSANLTNDVTKMPYNIQVAHAAKNSPEGNQQNINFKEINSKQEDDIDVFKVNKCDNKLTSIKEADLFPDKEKSSYYLANEEMKEIKNHLQVEKKVSSDHLSNSRRPKTASFALYNNLHINVDSLKDYQNKNKQENNVFEVKESLTPENVLNRITSAKLGVSQNDYINYQHLKRKSKKKLTKVTKNLDNSLLINGAIEMISKKNNQNEIDLNISEMDSSHDSEIKYKSKNLAFLDNN